MRTTQASAFQALAAMQLSSAIATAAVFATRRAPHQCRQPTYDADHDLDFPFRSMVVFGDSFSDVGNIHAASNDTQPGAWSYDGRYSDGRVWHEYLAQFFDLPELAPSSQGGFGYAWGGATTDNAYIDAFSTYLNASVPGVDQQIATYLDDLEERGRGVGVAPPGAAPRASPDALHVLFSGYNDYWYYVYRNYTTSKGPEAAPRVYATVAGSIVANVHRLYQAGARQFVVANVMNMSHWADAGRQTPEALASYDALVAGHNRVLADLLDGFEDAHGDATVYRFDAFGAFECLDDRRDFLGVGNVRDPCHSAAGDCGAVFGYKFWDWYHPTTHAHHFASTSVIQSIYDERMRNSSGHRASTSLRTRQQV